MSKLIHYSGPAGSYILPLGFVRLSGLITPGKETQYIDTGVVPDDTTVVNIQCKIDSTTAYGCLFGVENKANDYVWRLDVPNNALFMKCYYNRSNKKNISINNNIRHDIIMGNGKIYHNSDTVTSYTGSISTTRTLGLLGLNRSGTGCDMGAKITLYKCSIWKNGILQKDYIPVKKSDGTIGLLNLVNNSYSVITDAIALNECPQGFPTSKYCQVETHSAVTQTSDVIPCYRRSDGKPGKYTLSTNTFTEVQGTIGPSITFGWGEVVNGAVGFPQTSAYDSNIYYEPDGSAWIRVFHHNNPANNKFSSSDPFTTSFKKNDNMWWDMPKFNQITDNIYDIMVKYKTTSNASEIKHRWVQYTNPMSGTFEDTTYDKVTKSYYYGSTIMNNSYGGFYRDTSNNAYIVNNNNNRNQWWGAIGCWSDFYNGIPGPNDTTITSGYVDVYMRIPNHSAIPHNISTGDGRNGEKNGSFTGGYISTSRLESLKNSNFTIAGWFYPTGSSVQANNALMSLGNTKNGAVILETNRYFSYSTAAIGYPNIPLNTWTHISLVRDGDILKYYKNGVYQNQINCANMVDTNELWVGARIGGSVQPCKFQDIQVWDEIKNPTELM